MNSSKSLSCPNCNGNYFKMKRQATYVYTYNINTELTEQWSEEGEALPFLFDNREQTDSKEFLECAQCGETFPCQLLTDKEKISVTILQKAIRSDFKEEPEFFG
ncbi:hypothetical protein N4T77_02460 [Clostridium sp. CX1]|uniref:Uncharacterized protein n=1 Tax=Clostridium tanneri TaxID=3037988 RepID=A0ABU4JUU7_9CLOT|nr:MULTISPECIES: hypothetical protein [unclassified Clostridium]MCT8975452.1 hypothetical protein [Clostridium sp. CX1]MDW8801918.1 hypothetical protein [Clostridium sp. A1-XYC3]